ncbi:MAG: hypothetical protein K8U03_02310 [Planctomycetia bacterium]|nr:hypothetical protein [Planctomycetia bacterium]
MADATPLSGPVFTAVGENGLRIFSRDGRTWDHSQSGREGEVFSTACFGGGKCVVGGRFGGENIFAASTDGAQWQPAKHNAQYANYISCLVYFRNKFIASGANFVIPSDDGITWLKEHKIAEYKVSYGLGGVLRRFAIGEVEKGETVIVGVGDFARCSVSRDGLEWKNAPNPKAVNTLIDVAYGNGCFVGGGMHGLRMRSVDGLAWTDRVVGEEGEHLNAVVWDGKQFVGIGQGATYFSPDGLAWKRVPNTNAPTTAAFGGGVYVGALWPGRIMRSTDAVRWEEVVRLSDHVLALAFGSLGPSK